MGDLLQDKWNAKQQAVEKAIIEIKTNETKLGLRYILLIPIVFNF